MRSHDFIPKTILLEYIDDSELGSSVSIEVDDVNARVQLSMSLTRQD